MDSLKVTDEASAAVAVAPRVSLKDIEAAIAERYDLNGYDAVAATEGFKADVNRMLSPGGFAAHPLRVLSVCILVMRNGFTVIGKSAPASPENFNADLGRQYAYEDAIRQLWPLMGFSLRDRLREGW